MKVVSYDFPVLHARAHSASFVLHTGTAKSYEQAEATPLASQDAVFAPTMRLGKVVDPANDNCPRLQPWTIFGSKPGTLVPYF